MVYTSAWSNWYTLTGGLSQARAVTRGSNGREQGLSLLGAPSRQLVSLRSRTKPGKKFVLVYFGGSIITFFCLQHIIQLSKLSMTAFVHVGFKSQRGGGGNPEQVGLSSLDTPHFNHCTSAKVYCYSLQICVLIFSPFVLNHLTE